MELQISKFLHVYHHMSVFGWVWEIRSKISFEENDFRFFSTKTRLKFTFISRVFIDLVNRIKTVSW